MAKVGFHERVLVMWQTDLRLRRLGDDVAALWLRLMMMIAEYGDDGTSLRMGSRLGYLVDIATLLSQSETQCETQIARLVEVELLTRDGSGTIGMPAAFLPTRRQIANRLNGLKGGRPRTKVADPRQREALLTITGGRAAAVEEKPMETQRVSSGPSLSLAHTDQAKPASVDVSDEEFFRIGRAAFAVAFDEARDTPNYGIVRQWIADATRAGVAADVREAVIVGACRTVAEQMARRGDKPRHMGIYRGEVAKAIAAYRPAKSVSEIAGERAYQAAVQAWVRAGDPLAPMPVLAEFVAAQREHAA